MGKESKVKHYSSTSFNFLKNGLIGKPITKYDWVAFLAITVFCLFVYCHQDIVNTGASSFTYLTGHFTDFYDYNVEHNVEPMNNYMPSTYLMFAIWNIPMFLLGLKRIPWGGTPFIVLMWEKLLPILFFMGCGLMLYKIGSLMGFGEKKSKVLTYVFLTSPVAFFGPVIFGQYDSFTVFFVLLGLYFYLKNNDFKFILFFAIAMTFKYFALLIFLPLLLLKEKNVFKIFKSFAMFLVPFMVECLFYIKSPMFHKGVFGFAAKDNLFKAGFELGFSAISLFLVAWVFLLCWAYYVESNTLSQDDFFKWVVYFSNFIVCLVFGICVWHPQWLLIAMPFMVLSTFINRNPKMFLLIDIFMFAIFIIYSVNAWQNGVDQHMLSKGIFKKLMSPINVDYGIPIEMCQFMSLGGRTFQFSLISGLFLVNLVFKHPHFCTEKIDDVFEKISDNWVIVRTRFLSVVAFWVIPTLACLVISMFSPFFILKNSKSFRGDVYGAGVKNAVASQIFVPEDDYMISEMQILLVRSGAVPIETNRNTKDNSANMTISMFREEDGKNMFHKTYKFSIPTELKPGIFKIEPTQIEKGKRYRIDVSLSNDHGDTVALIGKTFGGFDENNHAVIDGHMQGYSYCIDILGRRGQESKKES